ncbi:MAG: hypothetical protein KDA74_20555, partial [Planctomycetaceae bacterium]|nr:hypothetical protein [Planctomycetaceae bacterium]
QQILSHLPTSGLKRQLKVTSFSNAVKKSCPLTSNQDITRSLHGYFPGSRKFPALFRIQIVDLESTQQ